MGVAAVGGVVVGSPFGFGGCFLTDIVDQAFILAVIFEGFLPFQLLLHFFPFNPHSTGIVVITVFAERLPFASRSYTEGCDGKVNG